MLPQPEVNNFLFQNAPMNVGGMSNGSMQGQLFPLFPFSQTPNYPKVEAQEGNPYIMENKQINNPPQPMFDMSRYGMQSHPHPPYFSGPPDVYPHPIHQMRNNIEKEEVPAKNYFCE
jgi:hypothetical protein